MRIHPDSVKQQYVSELGRRNNELTDKCDQLQEALLWLWQKTDHFTCQFEGEDSDKIDEIETLLASVFKPRNQE